jgi:putative membrane protein insertion efficiency factor
MSTPSETSTISADPEMQPEHGVTAILKWPRGLALAGVTSLLDLYQALIAPLLTAHSGSACRFDPSCSRYAKMAMAQHGLRRGGYLTIRRLARCHPWGRHGYDPVPPPPSLPTSS